MPEILSRGGWRVDGVCVPGTKLRISCIFKRPRFPSGG